MKKIIFILVLFIINTTPVLALTEVKTINTDISIDKSGLAKVKSEFKVLNPNKKFNFSLANDDQVVKDLKISYKGKKVNFKLNKNIVTIDLDKDNFVLDYKIPKFIYKFKDSVGINYDIISANKNFNVKNINVKISTYKKFSEQNTGFKLLGKNTNLKIDKGIIDVKASNISSDNSVKFMATLSEFKFKKTTVIDKTFTQVYENEFDKMKQEDSKISTKNIIFTVSILLGVILIIFIVFYIFKKKIFDEYSSIKVRSTKEVMTLENADYCDIIPCNGDLIKIGFLANYFKISKNKSNIIGAYIIKWFYEDKLEFKNDDSFAIIFKDDVSFPSEIDAKLYDLLRSSSVKGVLSNDRLIKNASTENKKIIDWFNEATKLTIKDMYKCGYIKRQYKKNKTTLYIEDDIIDMVNQIQGLKKYILNFNQVPRKTELNEEVYRYLLILSTLFGIGLSFTEEILRKNKTNEMAVSLSLLEHNRNIYKDTYKVAIEKYLSNNKNVHFNYDPEE